MDREDIELFWASRQKWRYVSSKAKFHSRSSVLASNKRRWKMEKYIYIYRYLNKLKLRLTSFMHFRIGNVSMAIWGVICKGNWLKYSITPIFGYEDFYSLYTDILVNISNQKGCYYVKPNNLRLWVTNHFVFHTCLNTKRGEEGLLWKGYKKSKKAREKELRRICITWLWPPL